MAVGEFKNDAAKERARREIMAAAKKHGIQVSQQWDVTRSEPGEGGEVV